MTATRAHGTREVGMDKLTPGPWWLEDKNMFVTSRHFDIAMIIHETPQAISNAHAIAALPDMVEALMQVAISSCCETPGCSIDEPYCDVMICRSALTKARIKWTD